MSNSSPMGRTIAEDSLQRSARSPIYRAELERLRPFEEAAREVIRLRMAHSLSQQELARRVGTTKSAISRLESGQHAPNLATLQRIAGAFGGHVVIGFDVPEPSETARERRELAAT
jgi:DNA-binding XRE family transcriptional regulator